MEDGDEVGDGARYTAERIRGFAVLGEGVFGGGAIVSLYLFV